MIWKRSAIKKIEHNSPSNIIKLIFDSGDVLVESEFGMNMLLSFFDPEGVKEYDCIVGKELIYHPDINNSVSQFSTLESWEGPEIKPNEEIEYEFPTLEDDILERVNEMNDKALYPTDLKEAVIGYVERFGMEPLVLLDKDKCINILVKRDGMSREEAEEFFEVNTLGAWMGEGTPCFATILSSENRD